MENKRPQIEPLSAHESDEMWANIISEIRNREERKRKRNKNIIKLSASIAVAAMLIICCFVLYKVYKVPEVFYAEKSDISITLEDNSKVTLLKGGRLRVGKNFRLRTREVFLEGNAVFNVSKSKDHPFIVHTGSYDTKVLGTVFKITQEGRSFHVDLYEGKVMVNKKDAPSQYFELRPRETFSNMGSDKVGAVLATQRPAISQQKFTATLSFSEFALQDIMPIIEHTYNVQVKYPLDKTDTTITLVSKGATAEEVLERIAIQLNLNITKNNDKTFELED